MKNKYLYWLGYFCCGVLLFLGTALGYLHYQEGRDVRGKYTFDKTRQNINRLTKITLTTPGSGEINIVRQGDTWVFKEAHDYFANVEMLSEFYKMVNNSIIIAVDDKSSADKFGLELDADNKPKLGTIVKTYDDEGELLDDIVLSSITDERYNRYAKLTKRPYIYTVTQAARFSGSVEAWLPYPLLGIPQEIVQSLTWNSQTYEEQNFENLLLHSAKGRQVVRSLQFIEYQGLIPVIDFVEAYPQARARNIRVTTIAGLVYDMQIYFVEDSYWLKVALGSTKVPRKVVPDFVRKNQKYFNRWLFQLTDEQGALLYWTKLPKIIRKKS